jgi:hypothetical protein
MHLLNFIMFTQVLCILVVNKKGYFFANFYYFHKPFENQNTLSFLSLPNKQYF